MKRVTDERVKHRLIGFAVILSIAAIFAPAIMKKSNQRIDGNIRISVQLPPKPAQPKIDSVEKKALFDKVKVTRVKLPKLKEGPRPLPNLAKAESLSQIRKIMPTRLEPIGKTFALADKKVNLSPSTAATKVAMIHKIAKGLSLPSTTPSKTKTRNGYIVQLATFTQQHNARSLIAKLKTRGYVATYNRVKTHEGFVYRVLVGQVSKREQAQILQQKLADTLQLKGLIVATGEG